MRLFVTQQYLDFLARSPDPSGLDYWTSVIFPCGTDASCLHNQRIAVADAFYFEPEFQQSGGYVYRVYRAALGAVPTFAQFMPDRAQVVGGANLDQSKDAFALNFVQRNSFLQIYPRAQTASQFVDRLLATIRQASGVDLGGQRSMLVVLYDGTDSGRATIVRRVADDQSFTDGEYNRAFVLMEYFGYLRRDPDQGGFDFWFDQVNRRPLHDVGVQHAMACSFITAGEYQFRFGSVVTHTNAECPH